MYGFSQTAVSRHQYRSRSFKMKCSKDQFSVSCDARTVRTRLPPASRSPMICTFPTVKHPTSAPCRTLFSGQTFRSCLLSKLQANHYHCLGVAILTACRQIYVASTSPVIQAIISLSSATLTRPHASTYFNPLHGIISNGQRGVPRAGGCGR